MSLPYSAPMIFAAINWLDISINLLLIVFVIVCLLMSLLILMQRPKQEGLGAAFGGGVTDQVFGARTTNVLQKGTVYLGSLFFILSLSLAILIGKQSQQKSLLEPQKEEMVEKSGVEQEVVVETPPVSLEDELPAEDITNDASDAAVESAEEASADTAAPTEVVEPAEEAVETVEEAVEAMMEDTVEDAVEEPAVAPEAPEESSPVGETEVDKPE